MKKVLLCLVFCSGLLFANDELLLDSSNAYNIVLRANRIPTKSMIEKSSAVLIFPKFIKAGFILGANAGKGVMMVKTGHGWDALGVKMGGLSIGLQAGFENNFIVIYLLKKKLIQDIKSGKFTLGADASISFIDSGVNAGALNSVNFSKDMYAYSNNSGFFAGAKLGGSIIEVDKKIRFDQNSYGFKSLEKALSR